MAANEQAHEVPRAESAIFFVCAAMLIDTMSFGILIPVMPAYLVSLTGDTLSRATEIAGYLVVTFAVFQFLCGPLIGNLSDRYGRRPILLASMALFCVNYLAMGLAESLWVLFAGRALTGAAGAIYAPANAFVADITPPQMRAQRFALVGAAFGLGFILGPALGGLVGSWGPRAPFFVAAAMAGANLLFGLLVLPESLPRERRRPFSIARANPIGAFAVLMRRREIRAIVACIFLWSFAFQVYPATWAFFGALKFEWGPGAIGLSLAYSGVLMVLIQGGLAGRIVRAYGERRTALFGFASALAGMLANALATSGWHAYASATIGALHGLAGPALNAIATSRTPADGQGELQGAVASANGLAAIFAPLVLTQTLAFFTGPAAPFRFAGAAFALSAAIALAALLLFASTTRGFHRVAPTA